VCQHIFPIFLKIRIKKEQDPENTGFPSKKISPAEYAGDKGKNLIMRLNAAVGDI